MRERRWAGLILATSVVGAVLPSGCARKTDPDLVLARSYRREMEAWEANVAQASAAYSARAARVPPSERRAFVLRQTATEAETHERTLARLDALGPLPEAWKPMLRATRSMLASLARSARARYAAVERRDRAGLARIDAESDREVPRLKADLLRERNALARLAGNPERTEAEILSKR